MARAKKQRRPSLRLLGSARAQFPIREALIGWPSAHSWLFERLSSGMFLMNYPREIRRFKGALLPLFDPCFAANNFAETLKLGRSQSICNWMKTRDLVHSTRGLLSNRNYIDADHSRSKSRASVKESIGNSVRVNEEHRTSDGRVMVFHHPLGFGT